MPARSNIWTYLLIGAACLLLGFAGSTIAYRMRWLEVPGSRIMERLNRELQLNSDQRGRIAATIGDLHVKMFDLRRKYGRDRNRLFWDGFNRIRALLTPAQQKIFDRDFKPPPLHESRFGAEHGAGPAAAPGMPPPSGPPPPE